MPPTGNAVTELYALAAHSILCCHVSSHDDTGLHDGSSLSDPLGLKWWFNSPVRITQVGLIRRPIIIRLDNKW